MRRLRTKQLQFAYTIGLTSTIEAFTIDSLFRMMFVAKFYLDTCILKTFEKLMLWLLCCCYLYG